MAQVNFNDVNFGGNNNQLSVGFFSLKNNGDETVVRIMHDSTDDFDIVSCHTIDVEGYKFGRKVNCIRNAHEPLDKCPFCKANIPITTRLFIHLIEYTIDETSGKMIGTPKVWERGIGQANEIASLIKDYGPLSQCLFKVRRNGQAGDKNTTYSINYAPPAIYKNEVYPAIPDAFEGYSVVGPVVLNKSPEDMSVYLATGSFPTRQKPSDTPPVVIPTDNGGNKFASSNPTTPPWETSSAKVYY